MERNFNFVVDLVLTFDCERTKRDRGVFSSCLSGLDVLEMEAGTSRGIKR